MARSKGGGHQGAVNFTAYKGGHAVYTRWIARPPLFCWCVCVEEGGSRGLIGEGIGEMCRGGGSNRMVYLLNL